MAIELNEGESLDLGGYRIVRTGGRIVADRSAVCPHSGKCRLTSETPEVREGDRLDVFVDANMVETYVNDGEYVLSHAVYGLQDYIEVRAAATPELHALG
nr:GH32 C-terminal domain-containing protein [Collinsella tanakaei]